MQLKTICNSIVWGVLICCSLNITFNIIVFYFVEHIYNNTQKDIELNVAQGIIAKQSEQYNQLLESNREIRAIRHNYNNITTGLISELEKGNYDIVLGELYKLKQSFHESALLSNHIGIVHLLVNQKTALAKESDITIDFEYHDLYKIAISDVDLAIILGNALDNAIEATRKTTDTCKRQITVKVFTRNNNILVIIRNPVSENINVDMLETTKKDSGHHGIGIVSMKEIASRYNGEVLFTCQNKVFEATILLQNFSL